jgi:hypothetical protein
MSDERGERRKRRHSTRREEDSVRSSSSRERFKPPEFIFVVRYHLDDGNGLNSQYEIDEQRVFPRSSNKQNSFHDADQQQHEDSYRALHELIEAGKTRFGGQNDYSASITTNPNNLDSTNKQTISKSRDDDDSASASSSTSSSSSYHGSDPSNCTQEENNCDEASDNNEHKQNSSNTNNNAKQKSSNNTNKQRQQKQQRQIYRHRQGGMVSICSILPPIIEEGSDIDTSYSSRMSELHDLRLSIKSCGENIDVVSALGMEVMDAMAVRDVKLGGGIGDDDDDVNVDQEVNNWDNSARAKCSAADDAHEAGYWNDHDDLDVAEELMKAGARDAATSKSQKAVTEEKQIQASVGSYGYKRYNSEEYKSKSSDKSQSTLSASMPELSKSPNKYSPTNKVKSTRDKNSSFMEALRIVDSESKKQKHSDKPQRRPSGGSIGQYPIRRQPSGDAKQQSIALPLKTEQSSKTSFTTDAPKVRSERHARKSSREIDTDGGIDRAKSEKCTAGVDRGEEGTQSSLSTKSGTQSLHSNHHHHKHHHNTNELDRSGRSNSERSTSESQSKLKKDDSSHRQKIKSRDSKDEPTKSRSKRHCHHKNHDSDDLDISGRSSDTGKNESSKSSKSSEQIEYRSRSDKQAKHKNAAEIDVSERSSNSEKSKIPSSMKELLKSLPTHNHSHKDPADINEAISILSTAIEVLKAQESKSRSQTIDDKVNFNQDNTGVTDEQDANQSNIAPPKLHRGSSATIDSSVAVPLSETSSLIGGSSSVAVPPSDYSGFMDSNSSLAYPPSEDSIVQIEEVLNDSTDEQAATVDQSDDPDLVKALAKSLAVPPWGNDSHDGNDDLKVSGWKPQVSNTKNALGQEEEDPDLAKALAESLAVPPLENDSHDGNDDLEVSGRKPQVSKPENAFGQEEEDSDLAKALAESLAMQQCWENSSNSGIDDSDTSRWEPEVSMNESELFSDLKHRNNRASRVKSNDLPDVPEQLSKSSDSSSLAMQGDNSSGDIQAVKWKTRMRSDSNSSVSLTNNDDPQDKVEPDEKPPKGLRRLVRPKSIQHGSQQKAGFMSKVRHSFTSPQQSVKSFTQNLPAMGIHALEEGVGAIDELKKKAKERKQKIDPNGDVVLERRRTHDENKLRHRDREIDQIDYDDIQSTSAKDGSNETNLDRHYNRKSSIRSSQSSLSRSTVSRRSSVSSTSSNRRKNNNLSSSLTCLNSLNTNDRGELITWDDLEDAILVGLHNSLSDVNTEVNYMQDWKQRSTESISHSATNTQAPTKESRETTTVPQPDDHGDSANATSTTVNAVAGGEKGPWRCSFCTVINENPLHLICGVCNSPREN